MKYPVLILSMCAFPALAEVEIVGNIEAKCIIQTDTPGVYGNPTATKLSTLTDTVNWTGSTAVGQTTDATMSAYDTNKVVYGATTDFSLTVAGSTWFDTSSTAIYGVDKAFPGGSYTAIVQAECIAK